MVFAERLKQLRKAKDMSQRELARALHLGISTIAMYEVGSREPDFETVTKLADFFGVTTDYLLGRTNYPKGQAGMVSSDQSEGGDDDLYVVFRGRRQELPPEYKRVLIDMMEAAHRKMAEEKRSQQK